MESSCSTILVFPTTDFAIAPHAFPLICAAMVLGRVNSAFPDSCTRRGGFRGQQREGSHARITTSFCGLCTHPLRSVPQGCSAQVSQELFCTCRLLITDGSRLSKNNPGSVGDCTSSNAASSELFCCGRGAVPRLHMQLGIFLYEASYFSFVT